VKVIGFSEGLIKITLRFPSKKIKSGFNPRIINFKYLMVTVKKKTTTSEYLAEVETVEGRHKAITLLLHCNCSQKAFMGDVCAAGTASEQVMRQGRTRGVSELLCQLSAHQCLPASPGILGSSGAAAAPGWLRTGRKELCHGSAELPLPSSSGCRGCAAGNRTRPRPTLQQLLHLCRYTCTDTHKIQILY